MPNQLSDTLVIFCGDDRLDKLGLKERFLNAIGIPNAYRICLFGAAQTVLDSDYLPAFRKQIKIAWRVSRGRLRHVIVVGHENCLAYKNEDGETNETDVVNDLRLAVRALLHRFTLFSSGRAFMLDLDGSYREIEIQPMPTSPPSTNGIVQGSSAASRESSF